MTGPRNEQTNDDDIILRASGKIGRQLRLDAGCDLRRLVNIVPLEKPAGGWRGVSRHQDRWLRRYRRRRFRYRSRGDNGRDLLVG